MLQSISLQNSSLNFKNTKHENVTYFYLRKRVESQYFWKTSIWLPTLVIRTQWKWKMSQRMLISVASTLRKQYWNNFVNCCTDAHTKVVKKQNKIKFSSIKHVFLLYKNIVKLLFHLRSNDCTGQNLLKI